MSGFPAERVTCVTWSFPSGSDPKTTIFIMPPSTGARISLGDVAGSILDATLPIGGAPILSRRKGPERKIAEEKAEEKAKLALARAKRALHEQPHRVIKKSSHVANNAMLEMQLRKVATKGVVALFNAVRTAQKEQPEKEKKVRAARAHATGTTRTCHCQQPISPSRA